MADADGVFVKIFRDKKAWEQHEGLLETAKGKFGAEEEYRKKLCVEAGMEESIAELPFNPRIDPKLFCPEFDLNAPEYMVWMEDNKETDLLDLTKEDNDKVSRECNYPTEVLEEKVLFLKHRIFEKFKTFCFEKNGKFRYRLLHGNRGNKRYLIAWWGEREYYDKIQQKIAEIEAKKRAELEAAKRKKEEKPVLVERDLENPEKNDRSIRWDLSLPYWRLREWLVAVGTIIITVTVGLWLWWVLNKPVKRSETTKNSVSIKVSSPQPLTSHEKYERETSNSCTMCEINAIASVYELPEGRVTDKWYVNCKKTPEVYHRGIDLYSGDKTQIVWVTKEAFDKLKLQDQTPLWWCYHCSSHDAKDPINSVIQLGCSVKQTSILIKKSKVTCQDKNKRKEHYFVWCGSTNEGWELLSTQVTEELFEKLKIGDKIPFKRPEY